MTDHTPIPIDIRKLDDDAFLIILRLTTGNAKADSPFDGEEHRRAILGEAWLRGMLMIDPEIEADWRDADRLAGERP